MEQRRSESNEPETEEKQRRDERKGWAGKPTEKQKLKIIKHLFEKYQSVVCLAQSGKVSSDSH